MLYVIYPSNFLMRFIISRFEGDMGRGSYVSPERENYSKGSYQSRNDNSSYRYASNDNQSRRGGRGEAEWYPDGQSQWGYENDHQRQRGQYDDSSRQRAYYHQNDAHQRAQYNTYDNQRSKTQYDDTYQHQVSQVNEYREDRRFPNNNQASRTDSRSTRPQTKLNQTEEMLLVSSHRLYFFSLHRNS